MVSETCPQCNTRHALPNDCPLNPDFRPARQEDPDTDAIRAYRQKRYPNALPDDWARRWWEAPTQADLTPVPKISLRKRLEKKNESLEKIRVMIEEDEEMNPTDYHDINDPEDEK